MNTLDWLLPWRAKKVIARLQREHDAQRKAKRLLQSFLIKTHLPHELDTHKRHIERASGNRP